MGTGAATEGRQFALGDDAKEPVKGHAIPTEFCYIDLLPVPLPL